MKYCVKCGGQIKDEARFCNSCGSPVREAAGLPSDPAPVPVQTNNSEQPKKSRGLLLVITAIGIILLVYFISSGSGVIPSMGVPNTPEGVTKAFMEAVLSRDKEKAQQYSYQDDPDQTAMLCGLAVATMTDLSSDHRIRHYPKSYRLTHQSSRSATVDVYDQNNECFCTVDVDCVKGQWSVGYIR